jgi:hypothetical protein
MAVAEALPVAPENESELYHDIRKQFADEWDELQDTEYSHGFAPLTDQEKGYGTLVLHGVKIPRGNKAVEDMLMAIAKAKGMNETEYAEFSNAVFEEQV